jgi:hypothetical protein
MPSGSGWHCGNVELVRPDLRLSQIGIRSARHSQCGSRSGGQISSLTHGPSDQPNRLRSARSPIFSTPNIDRDRSLGMKYRFGSILVLSRSIQIDQTDPTKIESTEINPFLPHTTKGARPHWTSQRNVRDIAWPLRDRN